MTVHDQNKKGTGFPMPSDTDKAYRDERSRIRELAQMPSHRSLNLKNLTTQLMTIDQ
jgi:hypothetical protein